MKQKEQKMGETEKNLGKEGMKLCSEKSAFPRRGYPTTVFDTTQPALSPNATEKNSQILLTAIRVLLKMPTINRTKKAVLSSRWQGFLYHLEKRCCLIVR